MSLKDFTPSLEPTSSTTLDPGPSYAVYLSSPVTIFLWAVGLRLIQYFIRDAFRLRTLLSIGAVFQLTLLACFPRYLALIPACALCLHASFTTAIQYINPKSNPFIDGIVPGRTTAQIPESLTGRFGSKPASKPLVIFHFGVRFNHPLGPAEPSCRRTSDYFVKMLKELAKDAQGRDSRYGMLGSTVWQGGARETHNTILLIFYFRDAEGLHRFAHDDLHHKAWMWLRQPGHEHIAAFHETFHAQPGSYESVYLNSAPLLLGNANFRCEDENGEVQWVKSLVNADHPALNTMKKRMEGFEINM